MANRWRLALNGAEGRMGQALQGLLREAAGFELVAALDATSSWPDVGRPDLGQPEVVIDFSSPAGFSKALDYCRQHGVALVSGTTGLDASQHGMLADAARGIPVLHAANFSLGVAVLTRAVRMAAAALPGWDLEIVEAHHARKVDAPSGTALALGRAAAAARQQDFDAVAVLSRAGQVGARTAGAIGFATVRAGDVVGEHTALFASVGERLEFSHRATDRVIFARGALAAAAWLAGKPAGRYSIEDVIGG